MEYGNYFKDAFQKLSLLEQDFDISVDAGKTDELATFIADDREAIPEEPVFDTAAEKEDELQDNYVGKVIIECECCHSKFYKEPEDVIIDSETQLANIDEECPFCNATMGYTVIGKIEPFDEEEPTEDEVEIEVDDEVVEPEEPAEDEVDEVPEEEIEDEEEVEESFNVGKFRRELNEKRKACKDDDCKVISEFLDDEDEEDNYWKYIKSEFKPLTKADEYPKAVRLKNNYTVRVNNEEQEKFVLSHTPEEVTKAADEWEKDYQKAQMGESLTEDLQLPKYKKRTDYVVTIQKVAPGTKVYNKLEKTNYTTDEKRAYVITGTVGEQWPVNLDKLKKTYEIDDKLEELESGKPIKANPRPSGGKIAVRIAEKPEVVNTSWGDALNAKKGDAIAYSLNDDGSVNEKDSWVIDSGVFKTTYEKADGGQLTEDFKDVSITTDDQHLEMTSDESGKVTVTTEPLMEDSITDEPLDSEGGQEEIAPLSDEDVSEIVAQSEEAEAEENEDEEIATEDELDFEEPEAEEEGEEEEFDEFDEESFDQMGESYMRKVYDNVKSYKTTAVTESGNTLIVEGLITFTSGNTKKTTYTFSNPKMIKGDKVVLEGFNKTFSKTKKAFSLKGKIENNKFITESLGYHYIAKKLNESVRVNGRVKRVLI